MTVLVFFYIAADKVVKAYFYILPDLFRFSDMGSIIFGFGSLKSRKKKFKRNKMPSHIMLPGAKLDVTLVAGTENKCLPLANIASTAVLLGFQETQSISQCNIPQYIQIDISNEMGLEFSDFNLNF